ncbi:LIM domain-containing protein WLIM2b-like [Ziziphus jujuba]|uniref:LIM domain-containing protein WLIM2b-like n=1 Tax=Ziziphus jujuba TaxID=326968 RepID=A0A6P4AGF8_ZIZJJ|nr:LIM domain-containing protein WLIM2b-like [Ziziphus jujuba]XP_048320020.1 LIM domain-containing protein WLIM2b-like [Ziziphus jujuba var. spinosa]
MSFSGTQQKCKACDKTVHFIDMLSADGVTYHKTCFKCSHCNGQLVMSSYSSMDGVLYCKPHFEQLFKETGNFHKKFQSSGKPNDQLNRTPSKLSSMFSGTQDKCAVCNKTVYPLEKVTVEGDFYHKSCFRCNHGGCFLTPSSYAALDGILYCKHHFAQLFKEKGSYNHLIKTASMKKSIAAQPEQKTEAEAEPKTDTEAAEPEAEQDSSQDQP